MSDAPSEIRRPERPARGLLLDRHQAAAYVGVTLSAWRQLYARSQAATPAQRKRDATLLPPPRQVMAGKAVWLALELWEWASGLPSFVAARVPPRPRRKEK